MLSYEREIEVSHGMVFARIFKKTEKGRRERVASKCWIGGFWESFTGVMDRPENIAKKIKAAETWASEHIEMMSRFDLS